MRRWWGHARAVLPTYVFTNRDHGSKKDDIHGSTVIALVIASEQAVGALHDFDFTRFWIPSTCCLDNLLLPLGLTILDCIFFSYLFGWVFELIERSWTRTRQQERGFVYTSLSHRHDNGKRSTHQFLFPQDIPDGNHLIPWIYWLADLGSKFITGTVISSSAWVDTLHTEHGADLCNQVDLLDLPEWPFSYHGIVFSRPTYSAAFLFG